MPKLILVRILHGVVFSFSSVALTAFNTAFIPQDRLGEGLGWLSLAQIISFSVGPNLGLFIADKYGYMTCFYIAAGIYSVSTFLVHSIRYKHKTVEASGSESFNINNLISLRVLPYAALMGLFSCGNGLENTFIALLGDDRVSRTSGYSSLLIQLPCWLSAPSPASCSTARGLRSYSILDSQFMQPGFSY